MSIAERHVRPVCELRRVGLRITLFNRGLPYVNDGNDIEDTYRRICKGITSVRGPSIRSFPRANKEVALASLVAWSEPVHSSRYASIFASICPQAQD